MPHRARERTLLRRGMLSLVKVGRLQLKRDTDVWVMPGTAGVAVRSPADTAEILTVILRAVIAQRRLLTKRLRSKNERLAPGPGLEPG